MKNKKIKRVAIGQKRKVASKRLSVTADSDERYVLNNRFELFHELKDLILNSLPAERSEIVAKINKLGKVKLAVISGIFLNKDKMDPEVPDLMLVGDDLDRRKLRLFIKSLEAEVGKELKFALMDKEEFNYRFSMFDRFVRVLMDGPHEKLIDRLGLDSNKP